MQTRSNHVQRPQFLGIGAQKCGTSWLAASLGRHPDVWVPPRKELHYFDRSTKYESPSILASDRPLKRLFGLEAHNHVFRRKLAWAVMDTLRSADVDRAVWYAKYFLRRSDDQWYTSLFDPARSRVSGEISPSYSMLSSDDVGDVFRLLPEAKILFLIRNPIDRTWSQLRFEIKKKGLPLSYLSVEKVRERINSAAYELRGDYLRTISIWKQYYPEQQFLVGFFDDIEARPMSLLNNVFSFLGVDADRFEVPDIVFRVVNPSPKKDMPLVVRDLLVDKYYDKMQELSGTFGGHAKTWFEEMRKGYAASV